MIRHSGKMEVIAIRGEEGFYYVCSCKHSEKRNTDYEAWVAGQLHRASNGAFDHV